MWGAIIMWLAFFVTYYLVPCCCVALTWLTFQCTILVRYSMIDGTIQLNSRIPTMSNSEIHLFWLATIDTLLNEVTVYDCACGVFLEWILNSLPVSLVTPSCINWLVGIIILLVFTNCTGTGSYMLHVCVHQNTNNDKSYCWFQLPLNISPVRRSEFNAI